MEAVKPKPKPREASRTAPPIPNRAAIVNGMRLPAVPDHQPGRIVTQPVPVTVEEPRPDPIERVGSPVPEEM